MTEKKGVSPKAFYLAITVVVVIVFLIAAALFLRGGNQPASQSTTAQTSQPVVTGTTEGWDNYGRIYRLFVTVGNNGASGNVKVFAEVTTQSFAQTQDRTVYLDRGGSTTITFEFNSDWLAIGTVNHRVWAIVP